MVDPDRGDGRFVGRPADDGRVGHAVAIRRERRRACPPDRRGRAAVDDDVPCSGLEVAGGVEDRNGQSVAAVAGRRPGVSPAIPRCPGGATGAVHGPYRSARCAARQRRGRQSPAGGTRRGGCDGDPVVTTVARR